VCHCKAASSTAACYCSTQSFLAPSSNQPVTVVKCNCVMACTCISHCVLKHAKRAKCAFKASQLSGLACADLSCAMLCCTLLCYALCGHIGVVCTLQVQKQCSCGTGGLTGFNVAKDLLKLDFSSPEEAPEEFRAVVFNAPPAKKGMRMPSLTALEIQTQGNKTFAHLRM